MPHTTHAYPFEAKVGQFAGELSARFSSGSALRSFLLMLDQQGNVLSLLFKDETADWHDRARQLASAGIAHVFYDPLDDGAEYIWLSWQGIEQPVMERLIGQKFDSSDFQPYPALGSRAKRLTPPGQFPSTWDVMF